MPNSDLRVFPRAHAAVSDLPFPVLEEPAADRWRWPMPPFAWHHQRPDDDAVAQACRLETPFGTNVDGEMLGIEPRLGRLAFRTGNEAPDVSLPFTRFRRLTLTTPLKPAPQKAGAPLERVPAAAQERDYTLHNLDNKPPLTGRTAGRVETADGLFLFTPVDEARSVQRVFVPRWAYHRAEFGASAEETAAQRWISDPQTLLQAIEQQNRKPVLPIGQALLDLGMLTREQLEQVLAVPLKELPLGERLVAEGLISRSDLKTALAHKMGYPIVDLARFPIEPEAANKLPLRVAMECRAVPLMLDGARLVVAVSSPSRVNKLREMYPLAGLTPVAVLSSKVHIKQALAARDVWSQNVSMRMPFFATTL